MTGEQHIIHRLLVDVTTSSKETGYTIKDNAAGFVSDRIAPRLETLFEELERKLKGRTLKIEQLVVAVSSDTGDIERGDLDQLIYRALEKQLLDSIDQADDDSSVVSEKIRTLETALSFLQTGARPWWVASSASMDRVFERDLAALAAGEKEFFPDAFIRALSPAFVQRMVRQLPQQTWLHWFAQVFYGQRGRSMPPSLPERLPRGQMPEVWGRHLAELLRMRGKSQLFLPAGIAKEYLAENMAFLEKLTGRAVEQRNKETWERDANDRSPEKPGEAKAGSTAENESLLFENAGLILLHPFLKHFLETTGLMNTEKQLTDKTLAAHALHYLATGKEQDREYALRFEKFLCDIPAAHPLEREVEIPQQIREEARKLLAAVLEHWSALKSSSTELLQVEFLQREARLVQDEQPFRLVFARKTQDILMDGLPWNLSIVQLPWQKELIYVEW